MLILFLQVQDKFRLDLNDEEAVQFLQSLIDESVSAMFPVVVEQIHKFAQVNQSYINIYNLWFFHWRFIWSNVWWKIIIRSVLCDNKKKFIKLMHQKSMIVVIIHWCWKVIFHREDFNNISDLHLSQCFLVFYKILVQRRVKFVRNVFQTKLLSRLSHKICHLFSSPVLSHKLTISRMWLCFYHYHSPLYLASRAFLSLAWFWCTHERLYIS